MRDMAEYKKYPRTKTVILFTHKGRTEEDGNNVLGWQHMYRSKKDMPADLSNSARKHFFEVSVPVLKERSETYNRPDDYYDELEIVSIEVLKMEPDEWILTWFSHWTFDTGQTDEEILQSFSSFVIRQEDRYRQKRHESLAAYDGGIGGILMGAEERWRWSGGGPGHSKTDPPCRCEHCVAQGLIRINH